MQGCTAGEFGDGGRCRRGEMAVGGSWMLVVRFPRFLRSVLSPSEFEALRHGMTK